MSEAENAPTRAISARESGVICYAEMWNMLEDFLADKDAQSALDSLTIVVQQSLVRNYLQSPSSLCIVNEITGTRQAMIAWCQSRESSSPGR